jgi:hypothetical protein
MLVEQLTELGLWSGVARSSIAYALVSAAHILGLALLIGSISLVDLRLIGAFQSLNAYAIRLLRLTAALGVTLALLTGVLLISTKPDEYLLKPVVWVKLSLVAFGTLHALANEWRFRRSTVAAWEIPGARFVGLISLIVWLTVLLAGRWIAFS